MNSNNGSILVISITFMLIFSMLGVLSIYQAGIHNAEAHKRKDSVEAFWLADAGVEMAKSKLQEPTPILVYPSNSPITLGTGTFDAYSIPDPDCSTCIDRWLVHSKGTTGNQVRTIEAIVAKYDISNAITSHGPINGDCIPNGNATIAGTCAQHQIFDFESVFNGTSEADIRSEATYTYVDPNNSGDIAPVENITVVDLVVKKNINVDTANLELDLVADPSGNTVKAAFLLVDTSPHGCSAPLPKVHIDGSLVFRGIIWVIGEAEIKGTSNIEGTVFVDGDPACDTKVTGNAGITFDPVAIDEALDGLSSAIFPGTPGMIAWKEI